MQVEYATDIGLKTQPTLQAIYPHLLEVLIQVVKPTDIATFLGRKLPRQLPGRDGQSFQQTVVGNTDKTSNGAA